MELTTKRISGSAVHRRRGRELGSCLFLLTLFACATPTRPPSAVIPAQAGTRTSLDSTFFQLLPRFVDDARSPVHRAWPLLVDVESFAATGSRFVGHELSHVEVAGALNIPFSPMPTADLTRAWEAREPLAAEYSIHLRLDSLKAINSRVVATVGVLYMRRGPDGSYDGDATIFAITYDHSAAGWYMVSREVLLIT